MFTIKAASELTAVPVATLRAWERRYGIATPRRTDAGYRVYDERAIAEIRLMATLVNSGWAARQAADEVLRRRITGVPAFDALAGAHAGLPGPESLLEAAASLDDAAVSMLLDEAFTRASFEHVLEAWLVPALHLIGQSWREGRLEITAEHLVSAAIMRRLSVIYEASTSTTSGMRALVGLPTGGEHEIPALAFAIAARRAGLANTYLGPNLPPESWASAARHPSISALVISVTTIGDAKAASAVVDAVRAVRPEMCIAVGGPHAAKVNGALSLGDGIVDSVHNLIRTLQSQTTRS